MGWAFSTHEGYEMHTNSCSQNVKGRENLKDLHTDWRIILKWILVKYDLKEVGWVGVG
jgi:hypothetical protein